VTDDEVVGEVAESSKIQNEDVFSFLVERSVDDVLQELFQRRVSSG
jgi:hypothetical protein